MPRLPPWNALGMGGLLAVVFLMGDDTALLPAREVGHLAQLFAERDLPVAKTASSS